MGWKKYCLMFACVVIGCFLTEGFTNKLGATVMAIGFGMASYYDGKKEGRRSLLIDKARFWWK